MMWLWACPLDLLESRLGISEAYFRVCLSGSRRCRLGVKRLIPGAFLPGAVPCSASWLLWPSSFAHCPAPPWCSCFAASWLRTELTETEPNKLFPPLHCSCWAFSHRNGKAKTHGKSFHFLMSSISFSFFCKFYIELLHFLGQVYY